MGHFLTTFEDFGKTGLDHVGLLPVFVLLVVLAVFICSRWPETYMKRVSPSLPYLSCFTFNPFRTGLFQHILIPGEHIVPPQNILGLGGVRVPILF